jgi:general secretion pathway protein D
MKSDNAMLRLFTLFMVLLALLLMAWGGTAAIVTTPVSPKPASPGSADPTGAEITTLTPSLTWEPVFDAQLYSVYVRRFPFAENDVVFKDESVTKPPAMVPGGLLIDGEKYRWYVRAFNKAGWSDKSHVFNFTVNLPSNNSAPSLVAPGSARNPGPMVGSETPTFRWKPVLNARKYGLYVSKYPYSSGRFVYKNESITDNSFTLPKGFLSTGKAYRWNVKTQMKTGWGNPSQRFYFAVKASEEKTAGSTLNQQASATQDPEVAPTKTPAYPHLPNDVVVEGELPRWSPFVSRLYTPHLASADAGTRIDQISPPTKPSAGPFLPTAQPATPAPPAGQIRLAQAPGAPPTGPQPVIPPPPMPQGPQPVAQTINAAGPPPSPPPSLPRPNNQVVPPSPGSMVQMQFDNIELRDLIKFVSNIMGKNFIFDDNVVKGKVTILSPKSLARDEVFRVFESVLNYYGFSIVSSPEAYKLVKVADAKALAIESLDKERVLSAPPQERIATLIHPLEYLDSNTMVGILRPLMARDAYLVSVPSTNSLIMIDTGSNLQRLKRLVAELDIPVSKQLSSIEVYNVQHTTAADLAKTLQALLAEGKKAATPKDKIFITSYAPTNSLLVSAPAEDMKDIKRIIEGIDTIRPQVLVEAAIIEVSLIKTGSLGVDWVTGVLSDNGRGAVGGIFNPGAPIAAIAGSLAQGNTAAAVAAVSNLSGFNVGVLGGNITYNGKTFPSIGAFVRAIATEANVNILSTPQILTMNNEEAEIVVGENRPYLTSSRLDSAGNPINTFDYRDVGIKLKVKPYINKDGLVYLTLYQEVTKVTEATVGSGSSTQPAPTTLKRSTKTTVGVKDSQTIVISGLIRDDSERTSQGFPFLSSIPILGALFGVQNKTIDKTNLLVFITPRIIYSAEKIEEISQRMKAEQEKLITQKNGTKKEKE